MKTSPLSAILFAACLATPSIAATPVGAPNGTLSGEVAGQAFDAPVRCGTDGPMIEAQSHDGFFYTANEGPDGAVRAFMMSGMAGFTGYLGGKRYEFGAMNQEVEGFPFTYEGEVRSKKHGNYAARYTLDCPNG